MTAAAAARKHSKRIAYIRVSSVDQNPERQLEGIQSLSPDRVFTDKCSGKDTKRPQLEAMLSYVREGDTVVVHSLDRLGRNLDDLRKLVTELNGRGIVVQFLKENLTFTGEDSDSSLTKQTDVQHAGQLRRVRAVTHTGTPARGNRRSQASRSLPWTQAFADG